jgi:hypothetical protein
MLAATGKEKELRMAMRKGGLRETKSLSRFWKKLTGRGILEGVKLASSAVVAAQERDSMTGSLSCVM